MRPEAGLGVTQRKGKRNGPKNASLVGKGAIESRVFDSLPSHVVIVDEKARIIKTNKAWQNFAALNGLQRDFLGEDYLALCDQAKGPEQEIAQEAARGLRSALAGETDFFSLDYPFLFDHGKRWFQMRVIRLVDTEPAHFAIAHFDISSQKQAEQSHRESEEMFRRITENMRDVVCHLDGMGRISYASPSYLQVLGYNPADLIGQSSFSRIHPDDIAPVLDSFRDSLKKGKPVDVTFRYRHADGHYTWLQSSGSYLFDTKRKITGAVISSRDVTERKTAEEAVRISEERFRSLSESTSDWIWEVDAEVRYTFAGPRIDALLGYRPEEVLGKTPFDFMPPQEAERVKSIFDVIRGSRKPFSFLENVNLHKSGRRVMVETTGVPILDAKGNLLGYRGIDRDITQKKALEAQAIRVRHLSSIGELAAGVAHEINNPVTGIINYAQILADEAVEAGQVSEIPERIIKEGERIAKIVKNLLSFAREGNTDKEPVQVLPAIEDSIALMATLFRKEGIAVRVEFPDRMPMIVANRKDMQQVFMNILTNSRYALNKKYKGFHQEKLIKISTEECMLQGRPVVKVVFYDSGIGISPEVLSRIYDPFFSTKPPNEAMGLGLSITYGVIKDHRGNIEVESKEGEYTRVVLEFPAAG